MNHHYVFVPHDPDFEKRATALVADHRPGLGVRAVAPIVDDKEVGHFVALQAPDEKALQQLLDRLQLPATQPDSRSAMSTRSLPMSTPLSICGDVPCEKINQLFNYLPNQLPACDRIVFLVCEFARDIHDIADTLQLPPVDSHLAGVAIAQGNTLLLELANDDPSQLDKDIEQLRSVAEIRSIRTLPALASNLVRSPHQ
jgi:hypothetical protein